MIDYSDYSRSPILDPSQEIEYVPTASLEFDPALVLGDKPSEVAADIAAARKKKTTILIFLALIAGTYFYARGQS